MYSTFALSCFPRLLTCLSRWDKSTRKKITNLLTWKDWQGLLFSEHISTACGKAKNKMYVVRSFFLNTCKNIFDQTTVQQLFDRYLFYFLVIIYNHLYSTDKKMLDGPYNAFKHLGIEKMNLNETLKKRTKKIHYESISRWHTFYPWIYSQAAIWSSTNIQTQMCHREVMLFEAFYTHCKHFFK